MAPLQLILKVSSECQDAEEVHFFASEQKSGIGRDHRTVEGEEEGELIKVPMCFTHRENNLKSIK